MSKSKKFILRAIPVLLLVVVLVASPVFADIDTSMPSGSGSIGTIDNIANNVWGTVLTIAQILAFAAIIFAGVRYMFASADSKADIKKQLVILVVGAVLVFGASTVVQILMNVVDDIQ